MLEHFRVIIAENPDFGAILGVKRGGFWAVDASKVHKTVHTSKEYVPIDNKILMIYSYHNI